MSQQELFYPVQVQLKSVACSFDRDVSTLRCLFTEKLRQLGYMVMPKGVSDEGRVIVLGVAEDERSRKGFEGQEKISSMRAHKFLCSIYNEHGELLGERILKYNALLRSYEYREPYNDFSQEMFIGELEAYCRPFLQKCVAASCHGSTTIFTPKFT